MSKGYVVAIKDLVVLAQFDEDGPAINEIVTVENDHESQLLVDHLEPGGIAFCLNIRSDTAYRFQSAAQLSGVS
jgi:hypothetical protein